jgi:phospholipase C
MAAASKTPTTPTIGIGYYEAKDRPFMSRLAQAYTTCDRYFCSILGPTYPNRFFQHCGQTDRLDDGGPTGKYDASDIPFLTLWGDKYTSIWRPPTPPAGPTSASPWPQNPLPRPTTPGPPWPPRP